MAIVRDPERTQSFEHRPDAARGGVLLAAVAIAVIVLFLWLRSGTEAESSVTQQVASSSSQRFPHLLRPRVRILLDHACNPSGDRSGGARFLPPTIAGVPREIRIVDTMPRSPTGKILRRVLMQESDPADNSHLVVDKRDDKPSNE